MSNHPWRRASYMFSCKPDCPKRKPGCQDHCEQHAKDRAKWDERAAIERRERTIDQYTNNLIRECKDTRARCNVHGLLKKTPRSY